MAEPAIHTQEVAHHPNSAVVPAGFVLHSAENQAALEASNGQGNSDFGAPYPSSCHFLHKITSHPQGGCLFQDSSAFFEDPTLQSRPDFSCFAHPHAISAYPNAQLRVDCAGFPYPDALFKGPHAHLRTVDVVCATSCEESVRSREEHADSTEPCAHYEGFACPHVNSNDPNAPSRVVCAGSAHARTASVLSCEESSSVHEECGDSTEFCGSSEDFTLSHAGYDDLCDDNEDFTNIQESREDPSNAHDGGRDHPFEELVDPGFQELDAHITSILQPCLSECSSATSMVTNAATKSSSRLDNAYMDVDCIESHWTDAKHGSYLNYMETNFVKNLFGREYCALDTCGQGPFHQGSESYSPSPSTLFEFKSWQSGDWRRRSMLKPPLPTCTPLALLRSPWVDHFRHHNSPHAKHQIKMRNASTTFGIDEGEEVNSPSTELHRGVFSHLHTLRSKMGHEEKFLSKNGTSGNEAVGVSKQHGLQEFAHDTENSSFLNMKKRGFETDFEQEPSITCKRGRSLSDRCGVVGSTK